MGLRTTHSPLIHTTITTMVLSCLSRSRGVFGFNKMSNPRCKFAYDSVDSAPRAATIARGPVDRKQVTDRDSGAND